LKLNPEILCGELPMILKDMMREHMDVHTLTVEARIVDAARIMHDERVGSVIIVDEDHVVAGIITDRDIALSLALGAATPDSFVNEVMSRDVKTVHESMTLFDVTRFFRTAVVKRLPVVDSDKRVVGMVSIDDIMVLLAREMFDTCKGLEPKIGHMI
jgi:CBS domain-containing protein